LERFREHLLDAVRARDGAAFMTSVSKDFTLDAEADAWSDYARLHLCIAAIDNRWLVTSIAQRSVP
jgi:hypothetical protein